MIVLRCTSNPPQKKEKVYHYRNTINWTETEDSLFTRVNDFRKSESDLQPLIKDDICYLLAHTRCDEMMKEFGLTGKVTHNIEILMDTITHYDGDMARENLGIGYYSVVTCFNAWKESEDHYYNMVDPSWKYTGIAVKKDMTGRKFYCQVFAR